MNPGGLRDDFLVTDQFGTEAPGVVTLGEANSVQPFANGVVTMTLTGAQIKQVLEEQWQPAGSSRPFLALGVSTGFFFTYDAARAAGDRIVSITLNCAPINPNASYRVTVNRSLRQAATTSSRLPRAPASRARRHRSRGADRLVRGELPDHGGHRTPSSDRARHDAGLHRAARRPWWSEPGSLSRHR